jgi:putative ABC transport system permease protein
MIAELRQAFRALRTSPGFSALVIVVLAFGIGANTAIYSIVNGVLLRPLPFADAARLVAVDTTTRNQPDNTSYPDFLDWRAQTTALDHLAAYATAGATLTGAGEATSLPTAIVTADLFPMLGVSPLRGRVFAPADDQPGAERTVLLSEGLWTRRFGRDPSIVGRSIALDGEPFTVIGVMPAVFGFPIDGEDPPQLWMPVNASRFAAQWATQRNASFLKAIGHLREGHDVAAAQAELSTIAARLGQQYARNKNRGVLIRPFQAVLVQEYRLGLLVLLGAVAAVLLIACANVANLLLARGSSRRRELAVRLAIGASRGQLVRQLLAETLLLASIGGAIGALLALWGVDALIRYSPLPIPRLHAVHVDRAALLFTTLASLATGLLSGLVPAFQLSRVNACEHLKDGERGGTGAAGARTRTILVVAELTLSLVLLASAGLLVRTLVALQRVDPGFATERAALMELLLPGARYPDADAMRAFYRRLRSEVNAMPGISAGAVTTMLPLSGSDIDVGFTIEGRPTDPSQRLGAPLFSISPEYFTTMGIRLVKGRGFTERDSETAPLVIIVSEAFAAKYWPGEDPIGKRLTIGYNKTGPREVVGIVRDVKQSRLSDPLRPQMYTPFEQTPWPFVTAIVRTPAAPDAAAASMRAMLARVDPMLGAGDIRTLEQFVARSMATPRFTTFLIGAFAAVALLLAGFGLFSVMAYSVAQRRREIGIRMALGAQPSDVRAMVVGQALHMGAVGLAIGIVGAFGATRVLGALLYGVSPTDPMTFAGVCAALGGVMLVAAYLPARRATRIDPLAALRTE